MPAVTKLESIVSRTGETGLRAPTFNATSS